MTPARQMASPVEKAIGFMETQAEKPVPFWELKNKKAIEVEKSPEMSIGWSLDPAISIEIFRDEEKALNEAEVILLPEELQIFTQTLIQHPILLPISFSQKLSKICGKYHLRLTTQEPFEDFTARLADAVCVLGKKK